MSCIYIVTMVQASDGASAFTSLNSIAAVKAPTGVTLKRLILLNDHRDAELELKLNEAGGGEVISDGHNLGVAGGRNRLVREAAKLGADLILSVDDDILLPPDCLETLLADRAHLEAMGRNVGILTPATLDFEAVSEVMFDSDAAENISSGSPVSTALTDACRAALAAAGGLPDQAIYHMGIRDWRGAYLFAGGEHEARIRSAFGIEAPVHLGAAANLKNDPHAADFILSGAEPIEIDTAPGGICLYDVGLFEAIGGIDEIFNPFGFEDADFALRAQAEGYQHYCVPRSLAVHDIARRLAERSLPSVKATQGKAIGVFAGRHVTGAEAAAALAAFSWRVLNDIGAPAKGPREQGDLSILNSRLGALASYFGNMIATLPQSGGERSLRQILHRVALSGFPKTSSRGVSDDEDGLYIGYASESALSARFGDDGSSAIIDRLAVRVPTEIVPQFLRRLIGDRDLHATLSGTVRVVDGRLELTDVSTRLHDGFEMDIAEISANRVRDDGFPETTVQIDSVRLRDEGALQRLTHFFARLEESSVADFVGKQVGDQSNALVDVVNGRSDRLMFEASFLIDGRPDAPAVSASFAPDPHGMQNARQRFLIERNKLPAQNFDAAVPVHEASDLVGKIERLFADDPNTVPFPDDYDPAKPVRLIRKARYMAAGRGYPIAPNEARMLKYRGSGAGKRAFIIGNGPSLNELDLTLLKDEVTFGVNAIYLNKEKMGFLPTHYIVEDVFVAEDRAAEINALHGPTKWIGNYLRYCLEGDDNTCWMNVACDYSNYADFPHFSENAARMLWVGGTVSYICMQLAYFMGFDEVYLIGFDHSYSVPKEAEVDGRAITSTSDDPNHFHPDYFGKGYRWHDPRVDRMEVAYNKARRVYEGAGRKIFNATAGGHLEVFERVRYEELFGRDE